MSLFTAQPLHPYISRPHSSHVRPTLKRSQSPYTAECSEASLDRKRRRTSPTVAFAKLSLSPLMTGHLPVPISAPSPPKPDSNKHQAQTEPDPPVVLEDQRMRSVYSAYDIDPHRVFVDCIGSEPASPTESQPEIMLTCRLPTPPPPLPPKNDQQLVLYRPPAHLAIIPPHVHRQADELGEFGETPEQVPMDLD